MDSLIHATIAFILASDSKWGFQSVNIQQSYNVCWTTLPSMWLFVRFHFPLWEDLGQHHLSLLQTSHFRRPPFLPASIGLTLPQVLFSPLPSCLNLTLPKGWQPFLGWSLSLIHLTSWWVEKFHAKHCLQMFLWMSWELWNFICDSPSRFLFISSPSLSWLIHSIMIWRMIMMTLM